MSEGRRLAEDLDSQVHAMARCSQAQCVAAY